MMKFIFFTIVIIVWIQLAQAEGLKKNFFYFELVMAVSA